MSYLVISFLIFRWVCLLSSSYSKLAFLVVVSRPILCLQKNSSALSGAVRPKLKQDVIECLDVRLILVTKDFEHFHAVAVSGGAIIDVRLFGHVEHLLHHPTHLTLIKNYSLSVNIACRASPFSFQ